jgi:hypothetical protein
MGSFVCTADFQSENITALLTLHILQKKKKKKKKKLSIRAKELDSPVV